MSEEGRTADADNDDVRPAVSRPILAPSTRPRRARGLCGSVLFAPACRESSRPDPYGRPAFLAPRACWSILFHPNPWLPTTGTRELDGGAAHPGKHGPWFRICGQSHSEAPVRRTGTIVCGLKGTWRRVRSLSAPCQCPCPYNRYLAAFGNLTERDAPWRSIIAARARTQSFHKTTRH